uniref:Uncharacterized protein n=1 Tax=Cacopsylla melanoneura TaxID=428564 RepID=A0A8D8QQS1_9HEMI
MQDRRLEVHFQIVVDFVTQLLVFQIDGRGLGGSHSQVRFARHFVKVVSSFEFVPFFRSIGMNINCTSSFSFHHFITECLMDHCMSRNLTFVPETVCYYNNEYSVGH